MKATNKLAQAAFAMVLVSPPAVAGTPQESKSPRKVISTHQS
jgi:hypothetical protein